MLRLPITYVHVCLHHFLLLSGMYKHKCISLFEIHYSVSATYCLINTAMSLDYLLWVLAFDSTVGLPSLVHKTECQSLHLSQFDLPFFKLDRLATQYFYVKRECLYL